MKQKIENKFWELFKARFDHVGHGDKNSVPVNSENEILDLVQQHRDGNLRIGFYNLLPNGTCPWAVVEFEEHGNLPVPNAKEASVRFMEHLKSAGIPCYREVSKNPDSRSYHVWIFFEKPMSAKKVHLALKSFVKRAMGINVEVFPKGYDTSKLGNFVWLPLFGGEDSWGQGLLKQRTVFVDDNAQPFADQDAFLTSILRTTESQFDDLISRYKLKVDAPTSYNLRDANLVDGLAKLRKCPFMAYCEDNAATLSEPLWYAWITNAMRVKGGREYVHEWSAKYPKYSKIETERKIAHALADTGPMTYESIINAGWKGTPPADAKTPVSLAYKIDIDAEVSRMKQVSDNALRTSEIEKFIQSLTKVSPLERDRARTLLKSDLGVSFPAFDGTVRRLALKDVDPNESLPEAIDRMKKMHESAERRGEYAYSWMTKSEVQFFKDHQHTTYALFDKRLEEVSGDNQLFREFFYSRTGVSLASPDGRVYVDVLRNLALKNGQLIEPATWIYTDTANHKVYFNLNVPERELVQIGPDEIKVVDQANNEQSVVLQDSAKIKPIKFIQLTDQEYKSSLIKEKFLLVDTLACSPTNRIFCNAWRIGAMFIDFVHMRPVLRFEGKTSSGKTFASDLFSSLVYGQSQKKIGTTASNYTDAAQSPILILDNVEVKNMTQELTDFVLGASVGTTKEKRRAGTDTANILERARCLILSNGIENFSAHEIINRTYIVEFDVLLYGGSVTSDLFTEIESNRNVLLSAEFMLISRVLKRLKNGDRKTVLTQLQQKHKGHSKQRSDEFFSIMIMITEELLSAWGSKENIWDLVAEWIGEQNRVSQETHSGANVVLTALDMLRTKAERHLANFTPLDQWTYAVPLKQSSKTSSVVLEGNASDFHTSLKAIAGNAGYDLRTPAQLAKRIIDAQQILEAAGYSVTTAKVRDRKWYEFEFEPKQDIGGTDSGTTPVPQSVPQPKNGESNPDSANNDKNVEMR